MVDEENKYPGVHKIRLRPMVILGVHKKRSRGNFKHDRDYLQLILFCSENYRQRTISEQILETFGQCQNCKIRHLNGHICYMKQH